MRIVGIIGLVGVGVTSLAVSVADKREHGISPGRSTLDLVDILALDCSKAREAGYDLSGRCDEALQSLKKDDRETTTSEGLVKPEDLKVYDVDDGYTFIKYANSPSFSVTEDGEDKAEGNLNPTLPPSNKRRRWGLGFGLVALFAIVSLLWVYRHSLPLDRIHIPLPSALTTPIKRFLSNIPAQSSNIPSLSASSFSFSMPSFKSTSSKNSYSSPGDFRPDSTSLLRWSEEDDPSSPSTSTQRLPPYSKSGWRSKLSLLGSKPRRSGTRVGGLFLGELDEEQTGYEEVGLLPSPGRHGGYGTV